MRSGSLFPSPYYILIKIWNFLPKKERQVFLDTVIISFCGHSRRNFWNIHITPLSPICSNSSFKNNIAITKYKITFADSDDVCGAVCNIRQKGSKVIKERLNNFNCLEYIYCALKFTLDFGLD